MPSNTSQLRLRHLQIKDTIKKVNLTSTTFNQIPQNFLFFLREQKILTNLQSLLLQDNTISNANVQQQTINSAAWIYSWLHIRLETFQFLNFLTIM